MIRTIVDQTSDQVEGIGLLIFIAIMLHKAPAAIGFGTFLHHEGLDKFGIMKHLFVRALLD